MKYFVGISTIILLVGVLAFLLYKDKKQPPKKQNISKNPNKQPQKGLSVGCISLLILIPFASLGEFLMLCGVVFGLMFCDSPSATAGGCALTGMVMFPFVISVPLGIICLLAVVGQLIALFFIFFQWYKNHKKNTIKHTRESIAVETPEIAKPKIAISLSTNKTTELLEAILTKNVGAVRTVLAKHPGQLNTAYAQNGNTPLHVATLNGYTEIVKLLLAQPGLDKTIKNNDGKTAHDLALEKGFTEIVELLR